MSEQQARRLRPQGPPSHANVVNLADYRADRERQTAAPAKLDKGGLLRPHPQNGQGVGRHSFRPAF